MLKPIFPSTTSTSVAVIRLTGRWYFLSLSFRGEALIWDVGSQLCPRGSKRFHNNKLIAHCSAEARWGNDPNPFGMGSVCFHLLKLRGTLPLRFAQGEIPYEVHNNSSFQNIPRSFPLLSLSVPVYTWLGNGVPLRKKNKYVNNLRAHTAKSN